MIFLFHFVNILTKMQQNLHHAMFCRSFVQGRGRGKEKSGGRAAPAGDVL